MDPLILWLSAAAVYGLTRLGEYRLHRQNYARLTFAGAEELIPRMMRRYYQLTLWILPLALIEHLILDQPIFWEMAVGGLALITLGLMLRVWAIWTLGEYWSMRCVMVQGAAKVLSGPYRFMRNPEYVSRLLDGTGFCLLLGSRFSLLFFWAFGIWLTSQIASVERRQLRELSGFSV